MKNGNKSSSVRESIAELNKRSAVIKEQRKILVSELSADIIKRLGSDSPETMYRELWRSGATARSDKPLPPPQ